MKIEHVFPILMISLMTTAAIIYAFKGDVRHSVYWFAAAILNISVTF
jgi:hypothetical protein